MKLIIQSKNNTQETEEEAKASGFPQEITEENKRDNVNEKVENLKNNSNNSNGKKKSKGKGRGKNGKNSKRDQKNKNNEKDLRQNYITYYNQRQEYINNNHFEQIDDSNFPILGEKLEIESPPNNLKIEEEEGKIEGKHTSNNLLWEAHSEDGIEDLHKLKNFTEKEESKILEEAKWKKNNSKGNKKSKKKRKQGEMKKNTRLNTEENKENKMKKSLGSDPDEEDFPLSKTLTNNSPNRKLKSNLSYNSEALSDLSEEKTKIHTKKLIHSTNPPSEISSINDSSAISNQDGQSSTLFQKNNAFKESLGFPNTTKNNRKRKKNKKANKNSKKSMKSARPKYG